MMTWSAGRSTTASLFSLAVCVYLVGITWGLPDADTRDLLDVWSPDDIAPLLPLTEVYNTFVEAKPDRFLLYPLGHHFLLTACYAPYLGWLWAIGQLGRPVPDYPFGLVDPASTFAVLTLIARVVSVAMAAGVAVIAYWIGRTLWDRRTAGVAFVCCAVPYPVVYYAKTGNLEIPVLFWSALGLLVYATMLVRGITIRRVAALAAFAALAAATKDQGAAVFLLMPIALLSRMNRRTAGSASGRADVGVPVTMTKGVATLVAVGGTVYMVASGFLFEPSRYVAHVAYLFSPTDHFAQFADFVTWYPVTPSGVLAHLAEIGVALVWILGPVLLLASVVGLGWTAARERDRLAFALPALGHLVTFLLPLGYFYWRFTMPIVFVLGLFGARGLSLLFMRVAPGRAVAIGLTALAVAWPVILSADLVNQMRHDARYAASEWLDQHTRQGQTIAHFGPVGELPRVRSGAEMWKVPAGAAAAGALARRHPDIVLIQPDWTSRPGEPHSAWCPPDLFRRLEDGSGGYGLVAQFQGPRLIERQLLDYPSVNPPVRVYARHTSEPAGLLDGSRGNRRDGEDVGR